MQGLAADDFIAQHEVYIHITVSQGGKDPVFGDGTPAFIGHCPRGSIRKLCRVARRADTHRHELNGGVHGQIIGLAVENGVGECSGAGSGRYHDQRGADRAGRTVRGPVHDPQFILTLLLGNKGT